MWHDIPPRVDGARGGKSVLRAAALPPARRIADSSGTQQEPDMIHPIHAATLDRLAATLDRDAPVVMLNLLRFDPAGGQARYFGDYVPAFRRIAAALGIEGIAPLWSGAVAAPLAAPAGEAWDAVVLVRYPRLADFAAIVASAAYRRDAAPHREAALHDWRLIAQTELARAA
jgi:hypothetical protein